MQLTDIFEAFAMYPEIIHNVLIFLADNIDYSEFREEIKQTEETSGKEVIIWKENVVKKVTELLGDIIKTDFKKSPFSYRSK